MVKPLGFPFRVPRFSCHVLTSSICRGGNGGGSGVYNVGSTVATLLIGQCAIATGTADSTAEI